MVELYVLEALVILTEYDLAICSDWLATLYIVFDASYCLSFSIVAAFSISAAVATTGLEDDLRLAASAAAASLAS